ncbi:MAG: hypothetical protein VW715_15700 [Rhodospirillales bacterium]
MTGFDSIQVRFKNTSDIPSPLPNTRVVPFIKSYFDVLKAVVNDIKTEYFWFFSNFVKMDDIDLDFVPEQHERDQIHVWYTTHPMGGLNRQGNVMLIPTNHFKEQMHDLKFLRDYKDINYHGHPTLFQRPIPKVYFKLQDPINAYNTDTNLYKWMINMEIKDHELPNFYPSFWEDVKMYSWGETNDIMLVPGDRKLEKFYDIDPHVHYDMQYKVKPMDIIFLSYDEPNADENWKKLKSRFPRAKRSHGVKGRTLAYHTAASMSETDYFFAVFPTIELADSFNFDFQPDRLREACHYIFHCRNPINGLEYGHRAIIMYNKHLCLSTIHPRLDFTLSQPHTVVPELCGTSHFNTTPEISWRVAFREVLKLCEMKPTVESRHRLKKWCELGKGTHAKLVQKGALDAVKYFQENKHDKHALMLSYELDWLKEKFNSIS